MALSFEDIKGISKWWQQGIDKERQRFSNAPKSPKSNKWYVNETSSVLAPTPGQVTKGKHARQR